MAALIATAVAGVLLAMSVAVLVGALDRPLAVAGFTAAMGGVWLY